jgi:hypothetical protein
MKIGVYFVLDHTLTLNLKPIKISFYKVWQGFKLNL